jgi:hypothetical protein
VLWFIASSPLAVAPVHMTAMAIADEVGMALDSVSRMLRELARHRVIVKTVKLVVSACTASVLVSRSMVLAWNSAKR